MAVPKLRCLNAGWLFSQVTWMGKLSWLISLTAALSFLWRHSLVSEKNTPSRVREPHLWLWEAGSAESQAGPCWGLREIKVVSRGPALHGDHRVLSYSPFLSILGLGELPGLPHSAMSSSRLALRGLPLEEYRIQGNSARARASEDLTERKPRDCHQLF